MNIQFVKMHTSGNDFVIIDNRSNNYKFKQIQISELSHRNTGIGFDQLIFLEKSKNKDILMKIFNSDGKEAQMCGNAAICVASLLFSSKKTNSVSIETISTDINANLNKDGKISITIKLPSQIFSEVLSNNNVNVNNLDFSKIHTSLNSGILVNMGNPHIVFIVKDLEDVDLPKYGSKIEKNRLFSDGINMEIVEIVNNNKLKVKFWERGSGLTLSCGSGILSAFYACYKNNFCEKEAEMVIPLGKVSTSIKDSKLTMSAKPQVSYIGEFSYE